MDQTWLDLQSFDPEVIQHDDDGLVGLAWPPRWVSGPSDTTTKFDPGVHCMNIGRALPEAVLMDSGFLGWSLGGRAGWQW